MHTLWPYFVFKYTPNLFRQSVNKSIWQVDGTAGTNIDIRMFTERNETENRHVFWNLRLFIVYIYIYLNIIDVCGELILSQIAMFLYIHQKQPLPHFSYPFSLAEILRYLRLADLGGHHRSPGKDHQGVERALIGLKQQKAGFVFCFFLNS